MKAHRCTGGLKKKVDIRSDSQRHRNFVEFFKVPVHTDNIPFCQSSNDWTPCPFSMLENIRILELYSHNYIGLPDLKKLTREKGRDLTSLMTKALHQQKTLKSNVTTQNFDYITTAGRLRTGSWSNKSHPTGVVKPVYGILTFPLTVNKYKSCVSSELENLSFASRDLTLSNDNVKYKRTDALSLWHQQ